MSNLFAELATVTGGDHVLTSPDLVAGYTTDWTRRYRGPALAVVRPAATAEVAGVLRCCARHGVAVVPQGGNTGLVGASIPPPDGRPAVVLSLRRLDWIAPVDTLAAQVSCGAGVTLAALHAQVAGAGLEYGVDLAARESATVGGTISTNAGGIHTIRYGPTRAQVAGVEAVLADGRVLTHMSGLAADNTGYDLAGLLTGSEGTLAVITAARLRLSVAEPVAAVLLAAVRDIGDAAALYARIRASVTGVRAAEFMEAPGVELARQAAGLPLPFGRAHPAYLLMEIAAADAAGGAGHAGAGRPADGADPDLPLERLARAGLPDDVAVASDGPGRAALWAYRERHTEAISAAGIPHKLDVGIPLSRIAEFRAGLDEAVAAADPDARLLVFGHLGAGNLHVNVLGPGPRDDRADEAVLRRVAAYGGTVSAEHGVGRAKARWLHLSRSEDQIAAMRAIKDALDPAGLLNPGVLFGSR